MDERELAEILNWATENVRKPWERMCEVAHELSEQRRLTEQQATVNVPLVPMLSVDWRAAYYLMRDILGLIVWDPANLFTIILSDDESKILRAYIEETRDNNFISITKLDPEEPYMAEALQMINEGRLFDLRWFLDERLRERGFPRVNWVKIANIRFFCEFRRVVEAYEREGKIAAFVREAIAAVQNIYANGWIRFAPEPPAFARLRQTIAEILRVKTKDGKVHLDRITGGDLEFGPVAVALRGRDYTTSLVAEASDGRIRIRRVELEGEEKLPLPVLAKKLRKKAKVGRALALRTEPLANLLFVALFHEFPWDREEFKMVMRRGLDIVRGYGEYVAISPEPLVLRSWFRKLLRALKFPYEISRLSSWYLPQAFIEGYQTFLGQNYTRALALLDGDRLVSLSTIEFWRGGIKQMKILEPEDYRHTFEPFPKTYEEMKQRAARLQVELWEREGWVDLVLCLNRELFRTLGELPSPKELVNPLAIPRLIKGFKRIKELLRSGAIAAYPYRMFTELENWVQERGRISIYSVLVKLIFDRYRPARQGLLYIRATVAAAIFVLVVVGLLIFL